MRRVVVTGLGAITPIGSDWDTFRGNIEAKRNGVVLMKDWQRFIDLQSKIAAPIVDFKTPEHYTRRQTRSMGRVALLATVATEKALESAGLLHNKILNSHRVGVAYGSSTGSVKAIGAFANMILTEDMKGISGTTYIQMMPHTTAVNLGVFFGLGGRVIPTSSACTSGSQGIGFAYESIKYGMQDIMIAGGAEELDATETAVFDTLFATSTANDTPELSPRPFDVNRDGLVIGEGAGTLILEEYEHAKKRGAPIYAEIVGFGCNSDGLHITQPTAAKMEIALQMALDDAASVSIDDIGYVCAHGTATDRGDIAETTATAAKFKRKVPISSLKSYIGHTLGACGAIEAWASIHMMNEGWFAPTLNLETVDPLCGELDYIKNEGRVFETNAVMSNNFAFGGINTSLIFSKI